MSAITVKNLLAEFSSGRSGGHHSITPEAAKSLVKLYKDPSVKVDPFMEAANAALRGFGVESIQGDYVNSYYQDTVALYVNTGDTYNATILFNTVTKKFSITSWGDFVEYDGDKYGVR